MKLSVTFSPFDMEDSDEMRHYNYFKVTLFNVVLIGLYQGDYFGHYKCTMFTLLGLTFTLTTEKSRR